MQAIGQLGSDEDTDWCWQDDMLRVDDETFGASTDPLALFPYDSGKRSGHPPSQTQFGNSDLFP